MTQATYASPAASSPAPQVLRDTPAIELRNVSCRFISPDGKATVALRDFTMSVARGEFVAIVGPTGCGKSTTLSMIPACSSRP
jgi:NitT/TauT family transport system ATP-binding protein